MKNVILLAPPAAGKGSISNYLIENLGYTHLSTGDILRSVAASNTKIGKTVNELLKTGKLISDEIILPLFKKELISLKDKPFVLDGIPRNLFQGEYLDNVFLELDVNNYVVINMDIDKDTLESRVVGRRICKSCGSIYNINFDGFRPIIENICDKCSTELIWRSDDNLETFNTRYETYLQETAPLINFYQEKGLLHTIDATKPSSEIVENIKSILGCEKNDQYQERTRNRTNASRRTY